MTWPSESVPGQIRLVSPDDQGRWELGKKNRCNDPHWGIVRIDLAVLPGARVHQDMHSQSGLIIDRMDHIPPHLVEQVM